ncbi:MAG: extracellular solute-binding protein [Oscillospiraceae bacterium]|nr:extracellular solute-binding protein [Oscillospiraceae bacterium]
MKKSRLPVTLLTAVILLLAACSPGADSAVPGNTVAPPTASPAVTLEYKPDYVTLPDEIRKIESVFTGDKIYFLARRDDGAGIYSMEYDGSGITELPGYAAPEGFDTAAMCLADGGGFWVAEYGADDNYLLRLLDENGAERASYPQEQAERADSAVGAGGDERSRSLVTDGNGSVYLFDSDFGISVFEDGNKTAFLDKKGESILLGLFRIEGGDVAALILSLQTLSIYVAPIANGVWGHSYITEGTRAFSGVTTGSQFYCADGAAVRGYASGYIVGETVFYWAETGIDAEDATALAFLPDDRIICAAVPSDNGEERAALAILTQREVEPRNKTALTMACFGESVHIKRIAEKFNRQSRDYFVSVSYYPSIVPGDKAANKTNADRFNLDMITGTTPDIMYVSGSFPERFYTTKGLLEDLYPYIDADPELSLDSFVPGTIESMDSGGRLYQLPDWFYINTVVGPKNILGDTASLTLDEARELLASTYNGESWSDYFPRGATGLTYMVTMRDDLIDWDTGECYFDTPEFIELLEFTNRRQAARGTLPLMQVSIFNMSYIATWRDDFVGGEEMAYVGNPGIEGNGSAFQFANLVSMYSGSQHKDGAWEFIRALLLPEFQLGFALSFPTNLAAFDTVLERTLQSDALDVSREEIEDLRRVIAGVRVASRRDEAVNAIIEDAAGAYFAGQKSAEETARDIQSRVSIYVSEQR